MPHTPQVTAIAPGSVGNVGPGLDILGLAVAGRGDTVTATFTGGDGVTLDDPGHPDLPADPLRHASAIAATEVLRRAGLRAGLRLTVRKGLPLAAGQGGSAASAVAGAAATNALLGGPLGVLELLEACLVAESAVAGRHADNIAPSLLGGAVLVRGLDPIDVVRLPCPAGLYIVLAEPAQRLRTADARAALPATVSREVALMQAANVAGMVAALASGDLGLLARALDDGIAEPARAPLLPGFLAAKAAALAAGAIGSSISGAGPTAFALVPGREIGHRVATAMVAAYRTAGLDAEARVCDIDRVGVRITDTAVSPLEN